ncbi:MAG: radical SAM protein, partial [Acidimicrobiia bacterium]
GWVTATKTIARAVATGALPGRLWLYSNYHCNLACTYCLTDSAPGVLRRELPPERMLALAEEARGLGFTEVGVTGGEPFLRPEMPVVLARLARVLPVVALSNGTLFAGRRLDRLRVLAGLPVKIQISLDHPESGPNDAARGQGSFAGALGAIMSLREMGVGVRVATTVEAITQQQLERLCALHRGLGIDEEDHVVRPVVRRGRAAKRDLGVAVGRDDLPPELTVTVDGAFWNPFGPTIADGRLDTDLLITRTISPLSVAAVALLGLVEGRPPGADAATGIR